MWQSLVSSLKNSQLCKDSFWALFGNAANKGLSLFAGIIIARLLGKEAYGEYGMLKNTLLYIAVFSTFGLGFTATKYISEFQDLKSKVKAIAICSIRITAVFSVLMAILVIVFAHHIALYLEAPDIVTILRITAITIIFNAITTTQLGILAGLHLFKEAAKNNFIVGIITLVASVLLTYFFLLEGAISALMIANIVNCILNYLSINRIVQNWHSGESLRSIYKSLIRFSFPLALQESFFSIQFIIGNILLVKLSNYGELGLYNAAGQWAAVILFIPSVLQNVALSHLSAGSSALNHYILFRRLIYINLIATIIPLIIMLAGSKIIISFYGDTYTGLYPVFIAAISQTLIYSLLQIYFQEYIATNQQWKLFFIRLGRDVLILILSYFLLVKIKEHGALLFLIAHIFFNLATLVVLSLLHNKFSTSRS